MGFDFVEVTRYEDDPNQLNVVGYNWGRVTPDEYIIIGGHFDIAYMFTPPGGGTNEGANDDTSGSTVSLEMAQALAQMEFDHTVVAGLWACEEEGLLGSLAYVEHLPENVSVRAEGVDKIARFFFNIFQQFMFFEISSLCYFGGAHCSCC